MAINQPAVNPSAAPRRYATTTAIAALGTLSPAVFTAVARSCSVCPLVCPVKSNSPSAVSATNTHPAAPGRSANHRR